MAIGKRSSRAPNLAAVLFITRSKPGSRLVFHYPPDPLPAGSNDRGRESEGEPLDSDPDSDSDSNAEGFSGREAKRHPAPTQSADDAATGATRFPNALAPSALDTLLGYSKASLEKLLSPDRWCDGKRFEISMDGLTFVGHPIFVDLSSEPARTGTRMASATHADGELPSTPPGEAGIDGGDGEGANGAVNITITSPRTPAGEMQKFDHMPDSYDSRHGNSFATSMHSASSTSARTSDQLTMFQVVFVLRSSKATYAADLHQHVAKKLSKALHYCHKRTGYLDTESRKLTALKIKARAEKTTVAALWTQMLDSSELAWALRNVYEQIGSGSIAGLRLSGLEISLQMPIEEDVDDAAPGLTGHSALLLLEDADSLLRNLTHPDASPLATFVRELTPAKSLEKNARNMGISMSSVMYMARHLIKWRKARAINPLHPRNIYIVSPDAPLSDLPVHMAEYSRRFSALPSLPQMLKTLSGRPIKYGSLIPSRDHREPYMAILAHLVRHRLVAQLRTFGWLQTPANNHLTVNQNRLALSVAKLLSPQLRAVDDDDDISVSSERTAIPLLAFNDVGRRKSSNEPPRPVSVLSVHQERAASSGGDKTGIIDPSNVSESEEAAAALAQIRESIRDDEFRGRFDALLPHLDGEHALEGIAAVLGLKRSKLELWLEALQKDGVLATFRHL